jgi:hypothetical protein
MPSIFNFEERTDTEVHIGMDFIWTINIVDDNDLPLSLTGYTFDMRVREQRDDADLLTLAIVLNDDDTGFYIADESSGSIRMKINRTDTVGFTSGKYRYDIIMTDPDDNKSILIEGKINFVEGEI